jgi:hypothetical protein
MEFIAGWRFGGMRGRNAAARWLLPNRAFSSQVVSLDGPENATK